MISYTTATGIDPFQFYDGIQKFFYYKDPSFTYAKTATANYFNKRILKTDNPRDEAIEVPARQ